MIAANAAQLELNSLFINSIIFNTTTSGSNQNRGNFFVNLTNKQKHLIERRQLLKGDEPINRKDENNFNISHDEPNKPHMIALRTTTISSAYLNDDPFQATAAATVSANNAVNTTTAEFLSSSLPSPLLPASEIRTLVTRTTVAPIFIKDTIKSSKESLFSRLLKRTDITTTSPKLASIKNNNLNNSNHHQQQHHQEQNQQEQQHPLNNNNSSVGFQLSSHRGENSLTHMATTSPSPLTPPNRQQQQQLTTIPPSRTTATVITSNKRPTIIIYPTVSPESIVIPIISCILGFPLLALLVICCLRRRAKLARERDRRRNYDMQDHAVSLVRFSPIHRLNNRSSRAISLRPERSLSRGFPSLELDTVIEERSSDPEQTQTDIISPESPLDPERYRDFNSS